LRFNLKTVQHLAELSDKDLRLVVLKSEFISNKRLVEFRKAAIEALSYQSKTIVDRRGLPKAQVKKSVQKRSDTKSKSIEMKKY
jgi:hypothetical protein